MRTKIRKRTYQVNTNKQKAGISYNSRQNGIINENKEKDTRFNSVSQYYLYICIFKKNVNYAFSPPVWWPQQEKNKKG